MRAVGHTTGRPQGQGRPFPTLRKVLHISALRRGWGWAVQPPAGHWPCASRGPASVAWRHSLSPDGSCPSSQPKVAQQELRGSCGTYRQPAPDASPGSVHPAPCAPQHPPDDSEPEYRLLRPAYENGNHRSTRISMPP